MLVWASGQASKLGFSVRLFQACSCDDAVKNHTKSVEYDSQSIILHGAIRILQYLTRWHRARESGTMHQQQHKKKSGYIHAAEADSSAIDHAHSDNTTVLQVRKQSL